MHQGRRSWIERLVEALSKTSGSREAEELPVHEDPQAETSEELLDQTRWLADAEQERAHSLVTRAGVVIGFAGAAIALTAGQAKELLVRADELGSPGREIADIALFVAVALVVISAAMALICLSRAAAPHSR